MPVKHIVGFSGGIDSQACCGVVLDEFGPENVIILNSQAGRNEHPLTVEHVRWYSENVHPVIEVVPIIADLENIGTAPGKCRDRRQEFDDSEEMDFAKLAHIKGRFPSSKAQFCTEFLKLKPTKRWILENQDLLADGYIRYAGVRADESESRKNLPEREWDTYYDCELVRPVLKWTKKQCFDYVLGRGEKINPLYTMGFSRVGCAPCINSNKEDVRNWAARFPEMIDKIRQWEKEVGRTFFPPIVPGKYINWIDEVVEWSKTVHGGRQYSLPIFEAEAESGACSSKYGLCE